MTDEMIVRKYSTWFSKKIENIRYTKGAEGQLFTSRFQTLDLAESTLGAYHHVSIIYRLVREFSEERKNLRWVQKLISECDEWKQLFEAILYSTPVQGNQVIDSLVKGGIDCETAIDLI